jgi:acyl carrier protein
VNDLSAQEAVEMLIEISGTAGIDPGTEFGRLQLDSLMLVEWVSILEEKLGVELDIRDLDIQELSGRSISDVLDMLRERAVVA